MSVLTEFTQDDVNRIVFHLKLPPYERRTIVSKSGLFWRLRFIEQEDERNGTDVVDLIKGYLDKLDELDTCINEEQEDGAGGVQRVSKAVDGHYQQDFSYRTPSGNGDLAQLDGKRRRYDDLVRDIKRELYLIQYDNKLPLDGSNPYSDYWLNAHAGLVIGDYYAP